MPVEKKQPVQPRDARIVSLILQSLGVEDYDPKVVSQLLEFAHSNSLFSLLLKMLMILCFCRIYFRCFSGFTCLCRTCE